MVYKNIVFDLDGVTVSAFITNSKKYNYSISEKLKNCNSYYFWEGVEPQLAGKQECFWIQPGIVDLINKLKENGYKVYLWTSRLKEHSMDIFEKLPQDLFHEKYYFDEKTHVGVIKDLSLFVQAYFPEQNVNDFFLIDDAEPNFKQNAPNSFYFNSGGIGFEAFISPKRIHSKTILQCHFERCAKMRFELLKKLTINHH